MSTSDDCPWASRRIYCSFVTVGTDRLRTLGLPRRSELVIAPLLAALGCGEVLVPFSSRQGSGSTASALVGVCLTAAVMLVCRRRPLVALLAFPVVWGPIGLFAPTYTLFYGQFVPFELALFLVARFGRARAPAYGAVVAACCLVVIDLTVTVLQQPGEYFFHWTMTVLVWSSGFGLRTFERRAQESTRRAVEAEVGAAEQSFRAVLEERTRIARELHDIVGHAVSSIVVQAGAAEQALDDTAFVERALAEIRGAGNGALAEMRRLVTMLRDVDDLPLGPQPTLETLPALVRTTGGPQVRLTVEGQPRPLPAGVDLAAYRIVQESLTNVRRHAQATTCDVRLTYAPDAIHIEVVDDGTGGPADATPGHGLAGMRERATLYGGHLEVGPRNDGGYAVRACLPVTT